MLQESPPEKHALALKRLRFREVEAPAAMQIENMQSGLEEACASRNKIPHSVTDFLPFRGQGDDGFPFRKAFRRAGFVA